jgi:hypothetical protein
MNRHLFLGLAATALLLVAAAFAANSTIHVIHGIPGQDAGLPDPSLPVDVLVNNAVCPAQLQSLTFGEMKTVSLPPGVYNFKIKLADSLNPCAGATVIEANVPFAANENSTVIAHLSAAGAPVASKFVNDVSRTLPGNARLVAHHTAWAPAVNVIVRRNPDPRSPGLVIENFSNGAQSGTELRPGDWQVSIAPANTTNPVFGPVGVRLDPFHVYFVYAVGSLTNDTFTLLVKPVRVR